MVRAFAAIIALVALGVGLLVVDESRPYPYPVAYKFGYQYREESLKEEQWQARFRALHSSVPMGRPGIGLARFWPRFGDDREGARACWMARRKVTPIPYLDPGTIRARQPTPEETRLEEAGWIAGYLESVHQHPGPGT
jgi:hypothetical protein